MDLLKQLALPQSAAQIEVLHFVLNMVYLLLLPFTAYLFGALLFSLYHGRKGRTANDPLAQRFAGEVMDHVLPNKSILFLFGVMPYLALVFAYAQLLQGTPSISVSVLTWGLLLFVAGCAFAYSYHAAFRVGAVLEGVTKETDDIRTYRTELSEQKRASAKYSVLFLFLAVFFLYAGTSLAAHTERWESVFTVVQLFWSPDVLVKFALFTALSLLTAAVGTLFFTFRWEGGRTGVDEAYAAYIRSAVLRPALVAVLVVPVLLTASVFTAPVTGLSGTYFGAVLFALLFLFLTSHFVYAMVKEGSDRYAGQAFYVLMFVFLSVIIGETSLTARATQRHSAVLAWKYDKHHEELLAKLGISLKVISGEEIFTAKCSACHEFGQKKVGPAYKEVLPKYEKDKAKLVSFVLNPVKVNPAFPPMPNQGLKPAEADSIASYILRMYKQ